MLRPLFYLGSASLLTLFLIAQTGTAFAAVFGGLALLCLPVLLLRLRGHPKRRFYAAVLAVCALDCALNLAAVSWMVKPQQALVGETAGVSGVVTEVQPDSVSGSHRCVLDARIEGLAHPKTVSLRLSSRTYTPEPGDWLSFTGTLYELGDGSAGMQDYYRSEKLVLGAFTQERLRPKPLSEAPLSRPARLKYGVLARVLRLRAAILERVRASLPEAYASVLCGMLLGDRSTIPADTQQTFRTAGVQHLFAVSGFHTSLWCLMLYRFLLRRGLGKKLSGVLAMAFTVLFMALTGFSASAVRAGVMMLILLLGRILVRQPDSRNSLGAAVLLLTLTNPFAGGSAGLLLSFAATLGILTVFPAVQRPLRRRMKRVGNRPVRRVLEDAADALLLASCSFLTTLPVLLLTFGTVSLAAPLGNLLVTPAASIGILVSGLSVLCAPVPVLNLLSKWGFLFAALSVRYMTAVSGLLAKLPFASVRVDTPGIRLGVAACLLLLGSGFVLFEVLPPRPGDRVALQPGRTDFLQAGARVRARLPVRTAALLCAIVLLGSLWSEQLLNRGVITVTVADVGNGSAVVVSENGMAAVIGCGGDFGAAGEVEDILAEQSAEQVTAVVVPRTAETEASAAAELLQSYAPGLAVVPKGFTAAGLPDRVTLRKTGDASVSLLPDVTLTLHASGDSPAALLTAAGMRILLTFRPAVTAQELAAAFGETALSADLLVTRAALPPGLNCTGFSSIIVSGEKAESGRNPEPGTAPTAFTDPGGITVSIRGGHYRIRRRST